MVRYSILQEIDAGASFASVGRAVLWNGKIFTWQFAVWWYVMGTVKEELASLRPGLLNKYSLELVWTRDTDFLSDALLVGPKVAIFIDYDKRERLFAPSATTSSVARRLIPKPESPFPVDHLDPRSVSLSTLISERSSGARGGFKSAWTDEEIHAAIADLFDDLEKYAPEIIDPRDGGIVTKTCTD